MGETMTVNAANLEFFVYEVHYNDEQRRRELAHRYAGRVVKGSGTRGKPKRMAQMVSVRLPADLVAKAGDINEATGASFSDILREGLRKL